MAAFRRLVFISVLAGLAAGLAISAIQAAKLWPLIAAAEVLEAAAPADHTHDHGWEPEGLVRQALTVLFNIAAGIGFALLLNALARLRSLSTGRPLTGQEGLLWGLAGFAAFALAPALGLPPELPGMASGDLLARQLWWVATAVCTGGALALGVFRGGSWIAVAVLLAILPHLSGVPAGEDHGPVPGELAAAFVAASLIASAVFWAVLGVVSGWINQRWGESAT